MITSVEDWLVFLKTSHALIGFPLIIGGAVLSLFGWRMWKLCVVASFAALGAIVGARYAPEETRLSYALILSISLGALSYWPVNLSVAVLGGVIGCTGVLHLLSGVRLDPTTVWFIGTLGFIGCAAYALINRQFVVIFVTAFFGAVLIISGLMAFVMEYQPVYGALQALATGSVIVVPFLLLVPAVMSSFYQVAEIRRLGKDL